MSVRAVFFSGAFAFLTALSVRAQVAPQPYNFGAKSVQESRALLDNHLLNEAKIQLHTIFSDFPASPAADRAELLRAESLERSGEYANAIAALQSFIALRPNSPLIAFALFKVGELHFEQKKYAEAGEYFVQTAAQSSNDWKLRNDSAYTELSANALFWQGNALAWQGKYEDAQTPFLLCAEQYPHSAIADDALFTLGQLAEMNRQHEKAIDFFARAASKYPTRNVKIASHLRAANNYLLLRNAPAALAQLESAETCIKESKSPAGSKYERQLYAEDSAEQMLYLRGEAHNLGNRYQSAIEQFELLLQQFPQSKLRHRAELGAGFAYLNIGKYAEAMAYNDKVFAARDAEPKLVGAAQLYRTIALKRSGKRDDAKRELAGLSVQSEFPFLGEVLLELGQIYYEEENFDEAQRALERGEREASDALTLTRIRLILGSTYLEKDLFAKAEKTLARAKQTAEQSSALFMPQKEVFVAEAGLKRGIALVGEKSNAEAIKELNFFVGKNPNDERIDEAIFWLAEAFYQAELMKNAEDTYQKIVKEYPQSKRREESLYGLGWIQFRTRQFNESSATFGRLLREYPKSRFATDVLTRKGDGHFLSKQYQAAADAYRQAARQSPSTEQGQYCAFQLAQSLFRMSEYEQAVTELRTFIRQYSRSSLLDQAMFDVAWIRFQQKRFAEAIEAFEELLKKKPNSTLAGRTYYAIGDAHYNNGNYEQSLAAYKKVADSYPDSPYSFEAVKGIQYSLVNLGKESEASLAAEQFIKQNPNSPAARDMKFENAGLFFNEKKYANAITEYEEYLKKYPDSEKNPEALYWLGKSYAGAGDADKAVKTFNDVQSRFKSSPFASASALELGFVQLQLNQPDKADSLFERVKNAYPESESAIRAGFEQAYLRESRGDTVGFVAGYRNVANTFKGTEYGDRSRYRLAMHFRSKELYDSARTELAVLTERNDDLGAESQYRIGELWMREKNYAKATESLLLSKTKFSQFEDWYTLSLLNLGECYENSDKKEDAKEMYRLVVALRGQDDFGKTASARLERLK